MNENICPRCKKSCRRLHKVKKRGFIFWFCYKCYKENTPKDRVALLHYHDNTLFNEMVKYYGELENGSETN